MDNLKRVCFADIDGVLNDPDFLLSNPQKTSINALDPYRIVLLRHLCQTTQAKVVLTSTWRDDLKARKYLKQCGIPIIGATPHGKDRGQEIHQWLLDKQFTGEYIILDDECSELNNTQLQRLVYTREGNKVGLSFKHLLFAKALFEKFNSGIWANETFITAILSYLESEWLRVTWNVYQKEMDDENPFRNSGNVKGFTTDIFEVHAYDWGWDFSDSEEPQPYNFKWRDLEITWYKWCGRGVQTNRPVTHDELAMMLDECVQSLFEWEKENTND